MPLWFTTHLGGKVDRCGDTYVATEYYYLFGCLPIVPLRGALVLRDATEEEIALPEIDSRSLALGYARPWSLFVLVLFGLLAFAGGLFLWLAPFVLVGVVAALRAGRLSLEERARRLVYAEWVDHPFDVALVPKPQRVTLGSYLRGQIEAHVANAAATGPAYRQSGRDWYDVALDPDVADVTLLRAGLTLIRIEWSLADERTRPTLAEREEKLFRRLVALDGSVLPAPVRGKPKQLTDGDAV